MSGPGALSITIGIAIMVVSLAMAARGYWRVSKPSSVAGYHSRRAAMVMLLGSELVAILAFVMSDNGSAFGLHGLRAELSVLLVASVLAWIAYQGARKRWPAGSD